MRRHLRNDNNMKNQMIIGVICVIAVIIALIVFFSFTGGEDDFETQQISEQENEIDTGNYESASTEIGKTVEESEEELEEKEQETNVNTVTTDSNDSTTSTILNEVEENTVSTSISSNETKDEETKTNEEEKKEDENLDENVEPEFSKPVEGEIIREFASDSLVYSNTLDEWITHNGIDIKADKTSVVSSAASGTVYAIKNDPRYGLTVIINHDGGYQTVYSNLLTAEFVVEGEEVEAGQTIGTVGNTASFEISDDYHLHFEILKNGEYIDPTTCIN